MADFHILFGFKEEVVIPKIVAAIRRGGHTVTYTERTTKESIVAYLEKNKDCCHAVLRECMGPESFSAKDFADLTDVRDINIVALVEAEHKGTTFMDTLYAAGITSGIIVSPQKGAAPGRIAELLLNKRTRKAARKYYGLQESEVRIEVMTYGEYIMNYSILMNSEIGINIIDRFIGIVKRLSPKQVAHFIKSLPANVLKEMQGYEEFWLVIDTLKKNKINITGTKPSSLKKGLTEEQFRNAVNAEYGFSKKKGIKGPQLSSGHKIVYEENLSDREHVVCSDTEPTTKINPNDVAPQLHEEENYFINQMEKEQVKLPNPKVKAKKTVSNETFVKERKAEISKEPKEKERRRKKETKRKKKSNWKFTFFVILLTIVCIATWCYLVFVYKI